MARPFFRRRKSCPFSAKDAPRIDYKDVRLLQGFVSERGKIVPSRITSVSAKKQRELAQGLAISGSLKAVNSALVKARVAGELRKMSNDLTMANRPLQQLGQAFAAHAEAAGLGMAAAAHAFGQGNAIEPTL